MRKKKYQGQSVNGYGGITDVDSYIRDRYGVEVKKVGEKVLPMESFTMKDLAADDNNCVLTGMTRILCFYMKKREKTEVDAVYQRVKEEALRKGYTVRKGLGFHKIRSVFGNVLKRYELTAKQLRAYYCFGLFRRIEREIDGKRPLLMNISFGYYRNHTVTVVGYQKYETMFRLGPLSIKRTIRMIEVADGWDREKQFMDFNRFHVPASITKVDL
jgi:hypothetical protein